MSSLAYSIRSGIPTYLLALTIALAYARGASGVTVSAGNAAGPPGSTVTIAISLENDVAVRAVQLRLTDIPNELTLALGSARTSERSAALTADANEQDDGSVIAILLSTGAALIAAGTGPVIELDFTIAPSASVGATITLGLSEVSVADENRTPLPAVTQDGSVSVALPTPTATATDTPTQPPTATATPAVPCTGDCDGGTSVTVDELITMVNIALGNADANTCTAGDADNSGTITIDEIIMAVNMALNGCE